MIEFFNIIKQAYYSLVSKDTDPYPLGQCTEGGIPSTFIRMSIYGIYSNPPKDSHILLFNSQGQESVKFGFINDFFRRKKGLKEGEWVAMNTLTGSYVFFKEDGSIELFSDTGINITGDLSVDGNIVSTGKITADGDIVADGISTKFHTHQYTDDGAPLETQPPTVPP